MVGGIRINDSDLSNLLTMNQIRMVSSQLISNRIPAGFGHAFISLQNDTIQLYSVDRSGNDAHSKQINYKDSKIGLKLPIPISEISDYDLSAPFVSESGEEIGEEDPHFYKALDMRKFR